MVNKKRIQKSRHFKNLELKTEEYIQLAKIVKKGKNFQHQFGMLNNSKLKIYYFSKCSGDLNNFQTLKK